MSSHRLAWLFVLGLLADCRLDLANDDEGDPPAAARDGSGNPRTSSGSEMSVGGANTLSGRGAAANDGSSQPVSTEGVDCTRPETLVRAQPIPKAGADGMHLSGLIGIKGRITLTGNVVIDPGTTFVMQADSGIEFAWNTSRTTLMAQGTLTRPIRFCRDELDLGHWDGLIIGAATTSDSVLANVEVYSAGSRGAAVVIAAPITVTNLSVYDSAQDGVSASTWGDGSSGLTIDGSGRDAVVATGPSAVDKFPTAAKFSNNHNNSVRLTYDSVGGSLTFRDLGIPYVQQKHTSVTNGSTVTFEAGVDYRFAVDTGMEVGWNSGKVAIFVNGTETAPVVFQGVAEEPGAWTGITIQASVSTDSSLEHVRVLHAGGKKAAPLALRQSIALIDVQVLNSAQPASLTMPPRAESSGLVIKGSTSYPLDTNPFSLQGIPPGSSFTGNAEDQIHVSGGNGVITGTIPGAGVPYLIGGSIAVSGASDFTFGPGAEFVFVSGYRYMFELGWNGNRVKFKVAGTPTQPVIFRGQNDEPGAWDGIVVRPNVSTDSSVDYLQVRNAPLTLGVPIPVSSSSFSGSATFGIVKSSSDMSDYRATNTFSGNAQGDISP